MLLGIQSVLGLISGPAEPGAPAAALWTDWWPTWSGVELPMLIVLVPLLVVSAFFSGMETALFGMGAAERLTFRRGRSIPDRAVTALLSDERMLLISILLGNISANVLYFVISSVLLMRSGTGVVGHAVLAAAFLLAIILFGEVAPKSIANVARTPVVTFGAPLLLPLHRVVAPLRIAMARAVVRPLSRLTAPSAPRHAPDDAELRSLLAVSSASGDIDVEEQRILGEVLALRRRLVRDVMTPRTRLVALHRDAGNPEVEATIREKRLTHIPVYGEDLDDIVGILDVKRFLLDDRIARVADSTVLVPADVVPEIATLDQLLAHFRRRHTRSAIVVDEFGGTEGVVSVEDVVERIVGDMAARDEQMIESVRRIGHERWRVDARLSADDWIERFRVAGDLPRVSTVGGLVFDRLGRAPRPGDEVTLETTDGARLILTVERVVGARIETVLAERRKEPA